MKNALRVLSAVLLVVGFAAAAPAGEHADTMTVEGKILCAKCTLKKADATECQNVLVVEGDHAGEYYLTDNEVAEEYGHVCGGSKPAVVTGTVEKKDGKAWLTATKMEAPKKG